MQYSFQGSLRFDSLRTPSRQQQFENPLSGTVKQEVDKERHFQNQNGMIMQEQIKSLEEKNKKLLLHNRKLSSEIRRVKSQIENVRARDNRHQIQIQEYRKLLNESNQSRNRLRQSLL